MQLYTFTCTECGQEIEVDKSMREAVLANGCPVCAGVASQTNFERV